MKKFTRIVALMLTVLLGVTLLSSCGANKYPALEKAFKNEGYAVNTDFTAVADSVKQSLEKDEYAIEAHMLTKTGSLSSVLIIEFKSTQELVQAYKDNKAVRDAVSYVLENDDVNAAYKALTEKGYANGNCLIIPLSVLQYNDILEIAKQA